MGWFHLLGSKSIIWCRQIRVTSSGLIGEEWMQLCLVSLTVSHVFFETAGGKQEAKQSFTVVVYRLRKMWIFIRLHQSSKSGESHSTREISVILLMTLHIENSHLCPPMGWSEVFLSLQAWGHVFNALSSQAPAEGDCIWKSTHLKGWVLYCGFVMLCVYKQILRCLPAGSFPVKSTSVLLISLNLTVSLQGWEKMGKENCG